MGADRELKYNKGQNMMTDEKIMKIIENTTTQTVNKLKNRGFIRSDKMMTYKKTEFLLKNYNNFKRSIENNPENSLKTQQFIKLIDDSLISIEQDPYFSIIEMKYFENKTRDEIAAFFDVEPKTITRNKKRLVNKIKVMLFSDDTISELFFESWCNKK